jgi:hypothetical protein
VRPGSSRLITQLGVTESQFGHSALPPVEVDSTSSDFLGAESLPPRLLTVA